MPLAPIVKRSDSLKVLENLLQYRQMAELEFYDLAMYFSTPEWKTLFIRLWQQEGRCVAELESKSRELGGHIKRDIRQHANPAAPERGGERRAQEMLRDSLKRHDELVNLYTDVLQGPLPFDLRKILQRHQREARETLETLNHISLAQVA